MAEISSEADAPPPPPPSSTSNSTTSSIVMEKRSKPPGKKRLYLTISVLLSFLAGLPLLLKSTEIYRSPLPSSSSSPLSFPCHLHAVFLLPRKNYPSSSDSISHLLRSKISSSSSCNCNSPTVSVSFDSPSLNPIGTLLHDDNAIDDLLNSRINTGNANSTSRVYTVIFAFDEDDASEPRVVVGKYRHAWIVGRVTEEEAVGLTAEVFVKLFVRGGREEEDGDGEEFMPVGLDGSVVLSFSLLNAAPTKDWVYDWQMRNIDELVLAPVVEALAPIANITVESQVLYHTPKSSVSSWDDKLGSYIFCTSDLPFFVNSNEWHLDTSIAAAGRSKVLQFAVYVPSADECPLLLRLPNGGISETNGFISPMWGGVIVWNPPNCYGDFQTTQLNSNTISPEDMQKIFQVFVGQLRLLFGFKSDYYPTSRQHKYNFLPSVKGFTEWELDALYRRHACSNLHSCASTLESLSKLVQSLPRMVVTDEIGKQVKFSLEEASFAQINASLGVYDASAVSSRKARALAEDAFFHPSIMSISYSSIEHYFAIYMPFFAPVSLHVLLAAIKEIKRYKKEKAKYRLFVASQTTAS